jgi:type IV pilus assembly protein PilY1
MLSYQQFPPIITEPTKPNVLIIMSNDWTGFTEGYHGAYDNRVDYWGYFDPRIEYNYKSNGVFEPKGKIDADHFTSNNSYWSGNILNWATMSHTDFLRKALTGGQRQNDNPFGTTLSRADIPTATDWSKSFPSANLSKLVPVDYADSGYEFYIVGTEMRVMDGNSLKKKFSVVIETCTEAYPDGCGEYYQSDGVSLRGLKPEGLLQKYVADMRFGLMSYSYNRDDQGGVLRYQIKDLSVDTIIDDQGGINNGQNMLNFINEYSKKGWDPLAEMFYDGVRYLRGHSFAQADFCPGNETWAVEGCKSQDEWIDPISSWCQKNNIIIINDEYPSAELDKIPNSPFSSYVDNPFSADTHSPPRAASMQSYNPEVTDLLLEITEMEGLVGKTGQLARSTGSTNATCRDQTIGNLADFNGICPSEGTSRGTFGLAALAYDAFKNDMRDDFANDQNFRTYAIAFRASSSTYQVPPPPLNQLWLAGKYGNYDEKNTTVGPDLDEEWMKSAELCALYPGSDNCQPKGFFYAEGGSAIQDAIVEVFQSILRRSASGTSVSVLATSGQGEGNLIQAYYRPARAVPTEAGAARDVTWTGYLQSLWVDKKGNLREDTIQDGKLVIAEDKIIKYYEDAEGTTRIARYQPTAINPYPDTTVASDDTVDLDKFKALWEAGTVLTETDSDDRNILTGIDQDRDGVVEPTETVPFTIAETSIYPYLGLQQSQPENGAGHLGKLEAARIPNLIAFIRGDDPREGKTPSPFQDPANLDLRDRRINITDAGVSTEKVWKLGDIINSTPISISSPPDRFDLIYGDATYSDYYQQYKNRETMVYVGANDGMLHAFTSWRYNKSSQAFEDPKDLDNTLTSIPIGSEVWAYIPQNLLPHLKWLSRPDYTHVHYMDMQPRIIDARIFPDDSVHPNGWGTVMIVGMNTGGGLTTVDLDADGDDDQFKPSYMAFDITEPRNPQLLWERAYDGLGFSRSMPGVIRIGPKAEAGDWYLVFGNGPDAGSSVSEPSYTGESSINGRIYIVDLLDGTPHSSTTGQDWWAEVADPKAFFNTPNTFDWKLNHNVDAAYLATTYDSETKAGDPPIFKGSVYRILTQDSASVPSYELNPNFWSLEKIFNSPRPITAQGGLSTDGLGNVWVYYGTGRYLNLKEGGDNVTSDQEYLLGIKDPYFNKNYFTDSTSTTDYYHDSSNNKVLETDDLMDASPIVVLSTGDVLCYDADAATKYTAPELSIAGGFDPATSQPCGSGSTGAVSSTFDNLLKFAQAKDGWSRKLPVGATSSERNLNRPAIFGGLTYYTTFTPTGDECSYGGNSTLWTLYYETGTAYKNATFVNDDDGVEELLDGSGRYRNVESITLGSGAASAIGFHIGATVDGKPKVKPFVQMGSGAIVEPEESDPPVSVGSGLRSWRERL